MPGTSSTPGLVSLIPSESFSRIVIDDNRRNVMSLAMLRAIDAALDEAERRCAPVILSARGPVFSAGFDLKTFSHGSAVDIYDMLRAGGELALRILSFPVPVVASCQGAAYPMGAFLIMASDFRIAAKGSYRIGMNEVAIGLTVPKFGIEIARQQLTPPYFTRTVMLGDMLEPPDALLGGFFDRLVPADSLDRAVDELAASLSRLSMAAHASTKSLARAPAVAAVREAIDTHVTLDAALQRVAKRDALA